MILSCYENRNLGTILYIITEEEVPLASKSLSSQVSVYMTVVLEEYTDVAAGLMYTCISC